MEPALSMAWIMKISAKFNMEGSVMKKIIIYSLSALAAVSCAKNTTPAAQPAEPQMITITASASADQTTKVSMGALDGTTYPMSWDEKECTYLREVIRYADASTPLTSHFASTSFKKSNETTGSFSFSVPAQSAEGTYDYVAVYPSNPVYATSLTHGVRYGGTDGKNRVSYILSHEALQVPAADGPDASTHLFWATQLGEPAQASSLTLNFESLVSYGKMTIKNFPALAVGETVSKITISAPSDKIMTGRLYKYFADAAEHSAGDVIAYSSTTVKNYVMIDPQNITFNTSGFDVWFTTFPFEIDAESILSVKVETSENTYQKDLELSKALSFQAGKVSGFTYNWTKGGEVLKKTLTFDFSSCPEGWDSGETEYKSKDFSEKEFPYTLDEVGYVFTASPCLELASSSTRSIAWGYNGTATVSYYVIQPQRFFGLPKIEGYKLTDVKFTQALGTNASRKAGITAALSKQNEQVYIPGGELLAVGTSGTEYTFHLTNTTANTRYYLAVAGKAIGFATMTLIYEEVK